MFQAHINVEYCQSVKAIKYICKYVNKGNDQAVFGLEQKDVVINEVDNFQIGRYISSNEAVWRILEFSIHEHYPPVVHLNVHLENRQRVVFNKNNMHEYAERPPRTTLTAFFELCKSDPFARTLLYPDVPQYYTWNPSDKKFSRKRGIDNNQFSDIKSANALGRVYTVHPSSNAECYFLRMLLHSVAGPTSFKDLKMVHNMPCETFREACEKRGLLEHDDHWENTMREASDSQMPGSLRHLFSIILTTCNVSNPKLLWEKFKDQLSEDIFYKLKDKNKNTDINVLSTNAVSKSLSLIESICFSINGKYLSQLGLPSAVTSIEKLSPLPAMLFSEKHYDKQQLEIDIAIKEPLLMPEQKSIYETILRNLRANKEGIFFIDAPGGTGKTFLLNLILAKVREEKNIALAVASSGYFCVRKL
jgi:hypothetical protein